MKKIKVIMLVGLFAIATMPAQAAVEGHSLSAYGGGAGVLNDSIASAMFIGGGEKVGDFGAAFGLQYLAHLTPAFGLGVEGMFNLFSKAEYPGDTFTSKPTLWTIMAIAKALILTEGKVHPYILTGIGMGSVKVKLEEEGEEPSTETAEEAADADDGEEVKEEEEEVEEVVVLASVAEEQEEIQQPAAAALQEQGTGAGGLAGDEEEEGEQDEDSVRQGESQVGEEEAGGSAVEQEEEEVQADTQQGTGSTFETEGMEAEVEESVE